MIYFIIVPFIKQKSKNMNSFKERFTLKKEDITKKSFMLDNEQLMLSFMLAYFHWL